MRKPCHAAACSHMFDEEEDGENYPCDGRRPSRQLSPCLLQGALADTTVRALGGGCHARHSAFVPGAPPRAPGFDAQERIRERCARDYSPQTTS